MTRRLTRRDALAATGAVALGSLAGCSGRGEPRFWDDPPSFDVEAVPREFDEPVPDSPRLVPVDVEPAVEGAFADRVDRLLSPVPEPLTAERLPNGEIREQIVTERTAARDALPGPGKSLPPLRAAERYAAARGHAATAVGTWAAVTVEGDPTAVAPDVGTVRRRASETLDELPGPAADPPAGAAVYGPIERWYDEARRRTLVGSGPTDRANPLRTGEGAGDVERVQSLIEAGRHLRNRYAASLDDPVSVAEPLRREMNRLGRAVGDRLRDLHGEGVEDLRRYPGTEAFVDGRAVARGAPSASLLSTAVYRSFDDMRFDPVAFGDYEPDHPATGLIRTALAWTRLRALDDVAARVEDGETMFPDGPGAVGAARSAAVESAASLAESENPLDRWLATEFLPLFAEPDGALAAGDRSARSTVEAYTAYRWIEAVTVEARTVTQSVRDSFEG
ncbi:hypothetical protein C463_06917 [Halorubrum californiense DSM 19288]|uniref:Uncharacterized protein n=1 Tax=Halorubrum californiense DSM 19288 TaxID=1227465 RepID=M0EA90_9EURY|nr:MULTISPECIES: hypothetical protein [Halorubrum]ELZ44670.1 hypothetical protein C463_06917 [Halorubrum californiense DSM 19288]TKX71631.1 hypothetical protein EXE40_07440 [Halorubrum sp. GN11GM_10-3_MGM]